MRIYEGSERGNRRLRGTSIENELYDRENWHVKHSDVNWRKDFERYFIEAFVPRYVHLLACLNICQYFTVPSRSKHFYEIDNE